MNKKTLSITIIFAIIALGFGLYFSLSQQQAKKNFSKHLKTATFLKPARDISPFNLTDNQGKNYSNKNLLGHWSLLFFGFTHCGHICPTTMTELKNMTLILEKDKVKAPQVILISVDPTRDTVPRLNAYVTGYNANFKGLTGSTNKIAALAKDLNILYLKIKPQNKNQNYDIDHSGTLLLINPQGHLQALFSMPHKAKAMAYDFELIQKYA